MATIMSSIIGSTVLKTVAPPKYSSVDHPLFNPQRVPRVLEDIEETRSKMEIMRGLYLKPQDQARLKYRPYGWLNNWLNPRKSRCCRCFLAVLRRNYGCGAPSKEHLEFFQEASRRNKGVPGESSPLPKNGDSECVCFSAKEDESRTHEVPTTNDGKDRFVTLNFENEHVLESAELAEGQFERGHGLEWYLHDTPEKFPIPPDTRSGVVVALKTGINRWGEQELIRLSVVDLYSGQVLIDNLVWPDNPLLHLDTKNSCITWPMMYDARTKGLCLEGREGALLRLWDFVTPNTYVVLHDGPQDMIHLRWVHGKIIDTHELEGRISNDRNRTLKRLAMVHLKRNIQQGRFGLDSLEDAMACRDLVFWYARNLSPEKRQDDHEPLIQLTIPKGPSDWEKELMEYECRIFLRIRAYHN
ncbi:uncharacterized protein N7484_006923 [Penicillium longicatenatum]|uniref:uncharacterized protein n=1 Tax=Penicillium longicatenatum TaxID=1561947 RepID=UPI002547A9D2|nr:uncharacterized protein N7484_006923 [Penicillium longicatenatum]KAJ5639061.1 hypothetical protein N7484_006923 [Penicillium longicatenatum]